MTHVYDWIEWGDGFFSFLSFSLFSNSCVFFFFSSVLIFYSDIISFGVVEEAFTLLFLCRKVRMAFLLLPFSILLHTLNFYCIYLMFICERGWGRRGLGNGGREGIRIVTLDMGCWNLVDALCT